MATKFTSEADFIHEVLLQFAKDVIRERKAKIREMDAISSGELLASFDYEIQKATIGQAASALIAFADSGRYLTMRKQVKDVDEIKEWLEDGGLEKFKRLPQVSAEGENKHRRLLNNLAWGIVKKHQKRRTARRKRISRGFENQLLDLIDELRTGYTDRTIEQIRESIQNR